MYAAEMYMPSSVGRGKQRKNLKLGQSVDYDEVQQVIPAVCLWTKLKTATLVHQIHGGGKIYFVESYLARII